MIWGSIITAAAIVLSAGVAIAVSRYHSHWATKVARTKASFDKLNDNQWDKDYILARSIFIEHTNKGANGLLDAIQEENGNATVDQETMSIESAARLVMNDYELTFIAIEDGVLDEDFLKKFRRATVIKDYEATKSYVEWMRGKNNNNRIFEVFQRNASRWQETSV